MEKALENNSTGRVGKWFHFACIILSPRPALLTAKRELSSLRHFSLPGKGQWWEQQAASAFSGLHEGQCLDSPHPEPSVGETYTCG